MRTHEDIIVLNWILC